MKMILLVLLFLKMSAMCSALPMMKVSGIEKDGVTRLTCLVYGFYLKNVTVKWVKNGIDNIFENQPDQTLLLPDETYQTTLSIDVQIKQFDTYACHMDHSSLLETVIVLWGYKSKALPHDIAPDDSPNVGLIVGLVVLVLISVCVLGLIIWKKCSGQRMNREGLNQYTYVFCFRGMRIISPRH